ncbi:MAG: cysteine desulfurase family protein [Bdellovibrio sp.]|jgi:cysteine desulfurase
MPAKTQTLYFDHNATTPADPRVVEAMLPYFTEQFGNTMSLNYSYGWQAESAVETARRQVAHYIGCEPKEITFTSGATESNNWAFEGLIEMIRTEEGPHAPIHLLVSPVEHKSVLQSAQRCSRFFGAELEFLPVNQFGQVSPADIEARLKPHTRLVSVMWVQNELGSVNPIEEIARLCHDKKVYFHSDATQAIGKIPVNLQTAQVDLLSFSAHKLSGPKGVGFLYLRSKNPRVSIPALMCGGGHERGSRSGTLNVPGIVGLGKAIELASLEGIAEQSRIRVLRDFMWNQLQSTFPSARLNGHPSNRSPNNLHVTFLNCQVPSALKGLAVSRGSACHSGGTSTSHVLTALGVSESESAQSLRITLGRTTTDAHVLEALQILKAQIQPRAPKALPMNGLGQA